MFKAVNQFCNSCVICIQHLAKKGEKEMKPDYILSIPRERLYIDITHYQSPYEKLCISLFKARDHFSKYLFSFALKTKEAEKIKKCLEKIFEIMIPQFIHSDHGREFQNKMMMSIIWILVIMCAKSQKKEDAQKRQGLMRAKAGSGITGPKM